MRRGRDSRGGWQGANSCALVGDGSGGWGTGGDEGGDPTGMVGACTSMYAVVWRGTSHPFPYHPITLDRVVSSQTVTLCRHAAQRGASHRRHR